MDTKEEIYKKKVVAFVDILGFKKHIEMTKNSDSYTKTILDAMKFVRKEVNRNSEDNNLSSYYGKEITAFSDSIVISYSIGLDGVGGGLFYVLLDLYFIQCNLLMHNLIMRGGIAFGDVYHKDDIVFGPAMIEAIELEKLAIFPRIIVRKKTIDEDIKYPPNQNTTDMERKYIMSLLHKADDDYFYLDLFGLYDEFDELSFYYQFLHNSKTFIEDNLKKYVSVNYKIYRKYVWLRNEYNSTIRAVSKMNGHGFKRKFVRDFAIIQKNSK